MPLEPYQQYQPNTPNATPSPCLDRYGHGRNISGSSLWSSPDSVHSISTAATHLSTPSASPQKTVAHNILPKIRTQDQSLAPDYYSPVVHRRAQSHDVEAQSISLSYRPAFQRSTTSPPEFSAEAAPVPDASGLSPWATSAADSPLTFSMINGYESSGHGRSMSTSYVGNPYYRTVPQYVTQESAHYAPAMVSSTIDQSMYQTTRLMDPYSQELSSDLIWGPCDDPNAINTIDSYLTEPNPTVYSVPESVRGNGNGKSKHFWWDVRNIRPWNDFNLESISSLPELSGIRHMNMKAAALPASKISSSSAHNPQDLCSLANIIKDFHIAKVNSALKASTWEPHMSMSLKHTPEDGYFFVSNLAHESDGTLGSRGKVIGLVKPFERWNSGKKREVGQKRVEYLQHLAHLQALMRQHNCRYGYIITEIELVCVRLGSNPDVPNFGFLELSSPIAMSTTRDNMKSKSSNMTACLALWLLNILARDGPRMGQPGCRIDVGPPEAHTRSQVLARGIDGRDNWMPRAQMQEMRHAKSLRGWVWPEDPVHRQKEGVGSARARRR